MVIGKDAKDVPVSEALSYVAAYTAGNDISSRKLQRDPAFAGVVPQWGFSKGFDTYAPLGPCLVAASEIPDPRQLHLRTTVDGEVRQDESVSDLLFDCAYLVSYLSQGTTLQKGSVIMSGTPGGETLVPSPFGLCASEIRAVLTCFRRWCWFEATKVPRTGDADGCLDIQDRDAEERRGLCLNCPGPGGKRRLKSIDSFRLRNGLVAEQKVI
jgi:hypothetical protein